MIDLHSKHQPLALAPELHVENIQPVRPRHTRGERTRGWQRSGKKGNLLHLGDRERQGREHDNRERGPLEMAQSIRQRLSRANQLSPLPKRKQRKNGSEVNNMKPACQV